MNTIEKRNHALLYGAVAFLSAVFTVLSVIIFWPQDAPENIRELTIESGVSLTQLAHQMKEDKLISNASMFLSAVKIMGKSRNIPVGTFTLKNASNNYFVIQQLFYSSPILKKITFIEGWNFNHFMEHISNELSIPSQEIDALCKNTEFLLSYGITGGIIEGYLFPDTYFFSENSSAKNVIGTLLKEGERFWTPSKLLRAKKLGFTKHEIITLASIIEGEAVHNEERAIISAVYHNRLKKNMKLQADPTIQFILDDKPRRLLNKDLKVDSPYNTYLYHGLPPGPINSPGEKSIIAALYPEKNDYLFFVATGNGYHSFSKNERQHNIAKQKLQKLRKALKRNKNI